MLLNQQPDTPPRSQLRRKDRMSELKEAWAGNESPPPTGMALSPEILADATAIIGKDELTLGRLAEYLPPETEVAKSALEVAVGPDQTIPILDAIARIVLAAGAVAQISTKVGAGTAFMIAPNLLMTNNHMFVGDEKRTATAADADSTVTFNYQQDINGKFAETKQYKTEPRTFFAADLTLDYAVVAVEGSPGAEWGTLALPSADVTVAVGDDVFIIQHPNGGPKQIAMAGNEVAYVDDRVIQYTTDTMKGSSGSPVLDWQWRLVALHHAGDPHLVEPASGKTYFRNEGIRLSAILAELPLPPPA
jgi:V8-like Glu-specific endopeptidase